MRITPLALEKIAEYLADVDDCRLRVAQLATGGGWGGKIQLGVTLDESLEEGDEVLGVEGFEVVIDRALHQTLGMVTIDYCPENGVVVKSSGSSGPACQQKAPA